MMLEKTSKRGKFAETTIGYVHINICEFQHAEGKLHMFLAIDRVSKFTYVESFEKAGKMNGAQFLRNVVAAFPYKIHTVLTDNGMAFADLPKNRNGPTRTWLGQHIFDRVCIENGITHKPTKPYHPWDQRPGRAHEPHHQAVARRLAKIWRVPQGGMTKKGRRRLLSGRGIGRRPFYHIGIWQGSEYTAARR
jgi:hypothetical protein